MENGSDPIIKGKISIIILNRIAELNDKKNNQLKAIKSTFNFTELALGIEMRNATITKIIRCQSLPYFSTILKCLKTVKMSLESFAKEYEKITDVEAQDHFNKMRKLYPGDKKKQSR